MLTISQIVTLRTLLRFQALRRKGHTEHTVIYPIRNVYFEWKRRQNYDPDIPYKAFDYSKSLLYYIDLHTCHSIKENLSQETEAIQLRYQQREEDFALYEFLPLSDIPEDRLASDGISNVERKYHEIPSATLNIDDKQHMLFNDPHFIETETARSNILYDDSVDLSGEPPHPEIASIIYQWFPDYTRFLYEYARPPSFGPQAFADFNRPTPNPPPPTTERHEAIMRVLRQKMAIKPYRPLHFADAIAQDAPLSTSASYHSKFDPEFRVFASYSAPSLYKDKPTSKGYNINVMLNTYRTEFHHIKYDGRPFPTGNYNPETESDLMQEWFAKHPAQLFIRTQISKRDPSEPKKIRPVYSVDDKFLHTEKTVVTPALAQLRNPECCVAHGLETFRGSMSLLDRIALFFTAFISLDWSQFDQRLPYYVIIAFFLDYIPSLLIVSHGYMPTREYPNTTSNLHSFARKMYNVMIFLCTWYLSMSFLSFDGFAFIRNHGGVPSGLLNTQFLDSFGNMYIILDCLLEFGFTESECLQMLFCVMGDDNLIFLRENYSRVMQFMTFLEKYAATRHGMVLSILKSVYTFLRTKISFLSYENSYGMPTRPIGKLVAQLAFPERLVPENREWIHAARSLGLAYAACGQSSSFHLLCKMVYEKFRPTGPVPTHHLMKTFKKWQYQLPDFDVETPEYTFPEFPTLYEIRHNVETYHGALSENDKWNFNVFTVPPSDNLTDYVTLKDYILLNQEMSNTVNEYWHGKRSY